MTDCPHPAFRFSEGAFYMKCTHCELAYIAIKKDSMGVIKYDHSRMAENLADELRVKCDR